jgi:hypothetical protein
MPIDFLKMKPPCWSKHKCVGWKVSGMVKLEIKYVCPFSWYRPGLDLTPHFAGDGRAVNSASSNFVAQNALDMVSEFPFSLLSPPKSFNSDMSHIKLSSLNSHESVLRHQTQIAIIESKHITGRMSQFIHILYQALSLVCASLFLPTGLRIDESHSDSVLFCHLL